MSAVGDYIHYYKEHYNEYGISRINDSGNKGKTWEEVSTNILSQINRDKTKLIEEQEIAKKLQEELNKIFYPEKSGGDKKAQKYKERMITFINNLLLQKYGIAAGKIKSADWSVDETTLSQQLLAQTKAMEEKIKVDMVSAKSKKSTLLSRINFLLEILNKRQGMQNSVELIEQIVKAKEELKRIENIINIDGEKLSETDIESLNKMIRIWDRSYPLANQNGISFEWLIPLAMRKGKRLVKKSTTEMIEKASAGEGTSPIKYIGFSKNSLEENNNDQNITVHTENMQLETTSVRNKTDVILKYDLGEGEQSYNLSLKNEQSLGAKLVDDTNLGNVLTFSYAAGYGSDMVYFATHYLNIVTVAGETKKNWSEQGVRKNANKIVQGLILKVAAEGYDIKNAAQFLVINNRAESKIYVYSIKLLIHILSDDNQRLGNFIKGIDENYSIQQVFEGGKDNKEEGIRQRIAGIIKKVNETKIQVALSGGDLQKYADYLKQ